MALGRFVEALGVTIWGIGSQNLVAQSPSNGRTGTVGLFEAATPLARVQNGVLVQVTGVNEGLYAPLVLVVFKVVHLL
jgi:hypothetical protein